MKKLLTTLFSLVFLFNVNSFANETLDIKKQLVGIVGAISGVVKTETRELKTGDKIYLNETIIFWCKFRNTNFIIRSINFYSWRGL